MDYKGSIKLKGPDECEFEANVELVGESPLPIDVKLKIKSAFRRGEGDPWIDYEVTLANNFKRGPAYRLAKNLFGIKDPKQMDAVFTFSLNDRNWEKSTVRLNLNVKGVQLRNPDEQDNWIPATHNMSASLVIIDIVEPKSRERQAKMTALLDIEENIIFDEGEQNAPNLPRDQGLFKKSILLEGMVNLADKGDRLAVIKATDAETDKPIGRIQARRPDKENLRLEVFVNGAETIAFNLYENSTGITRVTVEDWDCQPGTLICPNINRLLEHVSDDGKLETRLYNDVFFIGAPPSLRKREIEGDKGVCMEEKIFLKNGKFEQSLMFTDYSNVKTMNTLHCKVNNEGEETNIQFGAMAQKRGRNGDKTTKIDEKIVVEIKPSTSEEDEDYFRMKVSYKKLLIFDGYYYLTELIRKYAREEFPEMMKHQLRFKKAYMNATEIMRNPYTQMG